MLSAQAKQGGRSIDHPYYTSPCPSITAILSLYMGGLHYHVKTKDLVSTSNTSVKVGLLTAVIRS